MSSGFVVLARLIWRRIWNLHSGNSAIVDRAKTPFRDRDLLLLQSLVCILLELGYSNVGGAFGVMLQQPLVASYSFETNRSIFSP